MVKIGHAIRTLVCLSNRKNLNGSSELGSVAGPVIQANGRLTFEDDLRSGGLLCFISMNASVRTELANSMVTPGEPGGD